MRNISDKQLNRIKPARLVRRFCVLLGAGMLIGSCSFPLQDPFVNANDDTNYKAWKKIAADSALAAPPAPDFSAMRSFHGEKEAASTPEPSKETRLPQISIKNMVLSREMDVAVLLRTLADAADLNVIISQNVSGPVHVSLRHATRWDQLFLAITEARGIHYDLKNDLLSLYSVQDIQAKIAMEQALHDQSVVAKKRLRAEPTSVEMVRIHYADIDALTASVQSTMQALGAAGKAGGDEVAGAGATVLPSMSGSNFSIKAASESGQVILHGISSDLARARKLIQGLDQPAYQIYIEASIVQASNEVAQQLGVQWGVFDVSNSGNTAIGNTPNADGFNSNFPAGFDLSGSGFVFGASRIRGSQLLQAQLSALQQDGRLNIVSRNSITTLDQLTAHIESGEERPFSSAAGSGAGAISQVEFKKAALLLEVTPHVIDPNWVKLDINTTKDEFDDTRAIVVDGNVQTPILTRSAITSLYLATGQTTVIGGLSSESKSVQEDGIPFLKNIPGLGKMFRNSLNRDSFSDTLIFITPHILPRGQVPAGLGSK